MEKEIFEARFREAATAALAFARQLVIDDLPNELRFRLETNASHDGHPLRDGEVVFPEEGTPAQHAALSRCTFDEAVAVMWRDGLVPEWIDLRVVDANEHVTIIGATVCGRFTSDEALLYHKQEGRPPFHVVGPTLPAEYMDGDTARFSLHQHSMCASSEELEALAQHAEHVLFLDLVGPAFDDACLDHLPTLPNCAVLELRGAPLKGHGLERLTRLPNLEALRLNLGRVDQFSIDRIEARELTDLAVTGIPYAPLGVERLGERHPKLEGLQLKSAAPLTTLPALPSCQRLDISAPAFAATLDKDRFPALTSVSLQLDTGPTEPTLRALRAFESLVYLGLDDSELTDEGLELLSGLDVARLRVPGANTSRDARVQFRERNPGVELYPSDDQGDLKRARRYRRRR